MCETLSPVGQLGVWVGVDGGLGTGRGVGVGVGLELGVSWSGLVVNGNCSCFAGTCRVALARLSPHCALSLGDGRGLSLIHI